MSTLRKIKIKGSIDVLTGLHIGASSAFAAIGATDSPVIKDPLTNLPLIPGSSIKGKMRSLLARAVNTEIAESPDQDAPIIRRLFGDTEKNKQAKLIFRDTALSNAEQLYSRGANTLTEVKFENTIDRYSSLANPRQIERVIAGSRFDFELIYNLTDESLVEEDIDLIVQGLRLLELDYLGGHGSRGSGRIRFSNLVAESAYGEVASELINSINRQLSAQ
mgnify:FL=1|jgi:CRISPR-associated RAMP protein, csm3 family